MLLHGFPLDHHLWDEVVPLLEDTFDVILPDLRGFGESTTVDSPYSMDDYASDIAGLLDHLGIQKAAIVGHSMGGYAALAFARLYPQACRAIRFRNRGHGRPFDPRGSRPTDSRMLRLARQALGP